MFFEHPIDVSDIIVLPPEVGVPIHLSQKRVQKGPPKLGLEAQKVHVEVCVKTQDEVVVDTQDEVHIEAEVETQPQDDDNEDDPPNWILYLIDDDESYLDVNLESFRSEIEELEGNSKRSSQPSFGKKKEHLHP